MKNKIIASVAAGLFCAASLGYADDTNTDASLYPGSFSYSPFTLSLHLGANMAGIAAQKDSNGKQTNPARTLDPGAFAGLSAYYNYKHHGLGLSAIYMHNSLSDSSGGKQNTQQILFFLNLRHDFRFKHIVPYVVYGMGIDYITSDTVGTGKMLNGDDRAAFTVRAGGGINYFFNKSVSLGLGYNFL